MMGWDEILQPDLPKDVVIHSWRGQQALAEAARRGYEGILSNGYYIDLIFPTSDHYLERPPARRLDARRPPRPRACSAARRRCGASGSTQTPSTRASGRARPRSPNDSGRRAKSATWTTCTERLAVVSVQLEELGLTHEKNQAMLLRRLAGGAYPPALETLASFVEPVKEYRRHQQRPQTMLSPLTGLVDAARPDSGGGARLHAPGQPAALRRAALRAALQHTARHAHRRGATRGRCSKR